MKLTFYTGNVMEENHYYPFGLTVTSATNNSAEANTKKYQTIELTKDLGLELYETPLRGLDPQIGRWWQVDSKPDVDMSPYVSMGNNPISQVDPMGDDDYKVNSKGVISFVQKTDDKTDRLISVKDKKETINYNKKGELLNNSISLDKGIIETKTDYDKEKDGAGGYGLNFKDNKESATNVFNFLADNTKIEFGLVGFAFSESGEKKERFSVFTSYESDNEKHSAQRVSLLALNPNFSDITFTHNHPREKDDTGHEGAPSDAENSFNHDGDQGYFNRMWQINSNIEFFIREKEKTYPVEH